MIRRIRTFILKTLLLLLTGGPAFAAAGEPPGSGVQVYLVTLGAGTALHTAAGHAMLRIKGKGRDEMLDWGVFNPDNPGFFSDVFLGTARYRVEPMSMARFHAFLNQGEPRSVIEERLVLTPDQRQVLLQEINWWLWPPNRSYVYDERHRNCATIIRDVLDKATGGRLSAATTGVATTKTWRSWWLELFGSHRLATTAAALAFNHEMDRRPDVWQEMFVPERLRHHISRLGLSTDRRVISRIEGPAAAWHGYGLFWLLPGLPLVLSLLLNLSGRQRAGTILLGGAALSGGLVSTLYGVLIPLAGFFSDRAIFQWGANLWLFWPVDLLLVAAAGFWLRGRSLPGRWAGLMKRLCQAHLIGHACYLTLWLTGIIGQNIYHELFSIYPLSLAMNLIILQRLHPAVTAGGDRLPAPDLTGALRN